MPDLYADNYSQRLQFNLKKAQEKTSSVNSDLIQRYDDEMATLGLKKSTRVKQLTLLVNMTIKIGKDWNKITKTDIDRLVRFIMDEYGDEQAGETETTRDTTKMGMTTRDTTKTGMIDLDMIIWATTKRATTKMDTTNSIKIKLKLKTKLCIILSSKW